tara:strand:+ start:3429 stop:3749 length:321 start_codon:yes stop_codon:yes gene_type:complete
VKKSQNAGARLKGLAKIFIDRSKLYKDGYTRNGEILKALFPKGIDQNNEDDLNRYVLVVYMVTKMVRYADNFEKGGHEDSLDDLAVYAQILNSLDLELNKDLNNDK